MRILITIFAVLLMLYSHTSAQEGRRFAQLPDKNLTKVGSEALRVFSDMITEQNYKAMGFESRDEVSAASLGDPMRVFMVRLDHLQNYQVGSDPAILLGAGDQIIYPIMVDGQVRSSIVVEKVNEQWSATSFGSPNFVKMIAKVRKANADSTQVQISSYFIVEVAALNLYFLARKTDNELVFIPLLDDPNYEFKAGSVMSAKRAFEVILPAANAHDGLPR